MGGIDKRPITIGHENAGVVAALGEGVTEVAVGDRVGVCPTTPAGAPGYGFDGGFAPQMVIDAQALVPLPDGVDFVQGGIKAGDSVGMGRLESTINTKSLILNQCTLKGSNGGSKADIAGVYEYMATGKLNPTITTIGFDEIGDGLDRLKDGQVVGRLVATFE